MISDALHSTAPFKHQKRLFHQHVIVLISVVVFDVVVVDIVVVVVVFVVVVIIVSKMLFISGKASI